MALREAVKTGCYRLPDSLLLPGVVSECRESVAVTGKIRVVLCVYVHLRSVKTSLFPHHPGRRKTRRSSFSENRSVPAKQSEIVSLAKKSPACATATFAGALVVQNKKCTKTLYIYICIYKNLYLFLLGLGVFHNDKIPRWVGENAE